jgi:hypothetical protein
MRKKIILKKNKSKKLLKSISKNVDKIKQKNGKIDRVYLDKRINRWIIEYII